jgi:circadian clock protein KaiC
MYHFVPWGVGFFDVEFGGVPQGRTTLLSGRSGSGKTLAVTQFILQGLQNGESVIAILSGTADSFKFHAAQFGVQVEAALARGQMCLIAEDELPAGVGGCARPFEPLLEKIVSHRASRVVIDSILPWVCPPPQGEADSFLMNIAPRLEKTGATSLITLRSPASASARHLRRTIERATPLSVVLTHEGRNGRRLWEVGKYEKHKVGETIEFALEPGLGLIRVVTSDHLVESQPRASAQGTVHGLADVLLAPRRFPLPGLGETAG